MIGHRTRYSLAQLLEQQDPAIVVTLLRKHGAPISLNPGSLVYELINAVRGLGDRQVMDVLAEVVATAGDLRSRVNPKYRFDERMHDLTQCLMLDGYQVVDKRLHQSDPSIADAAPIDDDLIEALRTCGAPRSGDIVQKIKALCALSGDAAHAMSLTKPRLTSK